MYEYIYIYTYYTIIDITQDDTWDLLQKANAFRLSWRWFVKFGAQFSETAPTFPAETTLGIVGLQRSEISKNGQNFMRCFLCAEKFRVSTECAAFSAVDQFQTTRLMKHGC